MSYRTPVKNSSPLANYSFTTPNEDVSDAQNDTFILKKKPNTNGLLQLAALNNLSSTPKKQTQDQGAMRTPNLSSSPEKHFFSTPVKLEPLVESPFKPSRDTKTHLSPIIPAPPIEQTSLRRTNNSLFQSASNGTSAPTQQNVGASSGVSLFHQEPGRFNREEPNNLISSTNKGTSFQPILDENVVILMSRLQNKEFSFKKFVTGIFALLVLQLVNSIIKFIYYNTFVLDYLHDQFYNSKVVSIINYAVILLISINLITSALNLLQKQDQCLDLNLNNEQRKLLGLELILEDEAPTLKALPTLPKAQTPSKQVVPEPTDSDTIGKTNELLSLLKISTPRK